jgi:hypothetical protein
VLVFDWSCGTYKENSIWGISLNFEELFISEDYPYLGKSKRDNYLSRIFGIFNEEIIRIWCRNTKSPFIDLGRPTIYDDFGKGHTLDFLLKDINDCLFVTEMKCEIAYQKYKYLTLNDPKQIERHKKKDAFCKFLTVAKDPSSQVIKCSGEIVNPSGSALVWGRVESGATNSLMKEFSLSHIISTENVVADLKAWQDEEYRHMVSQYRDWSNELFGSMCEDL